jgi:hypothetical protein
VANACAEQFEHVIERVVDVEIVGASVGAGFQKS